MPNLKPILFTVFEPSGDVLAARLIAELKQRRPERPIVALGGPAMAEAGAELLEETTGHAKMLVGAVTEARELLRRVGVVKQWLHEHEPAAFVPTDSPAANWSMCKAVRKRHPATPIVHLVGPQLWAWASWRIGRMRRLSDHVLCLLPFEPDWFGSRGVPGTFVGHPLFQEPSRAERPPATADDGAALAAGEPRLAFLPGSRPKELKQNWPTMRAVYEKLRHRHPKLAVAVAAADATRAKELALACPGGRLPRGMQMVTGDAQGVLDWADVALVVSGTATLQAASRRTPMVVLYRIGRPAWEVARRLLISTRTFSLPNLIAESAGGERVVPELVPFFGDADEAVAALHPLLTEGEARDTQRRAFDDIAALFHGHVFRRDAADVLLRMIDESV